MPTGTPLENIDPLGNRYRWKYTTPPKRPDPKGSADRVLKILDAAEGK